MKLRFKRLFRELATECKFTFWTVFANKSNECLISPQNDLLSVAFSDIYMAKLENDKEAPLKPTLYRRYVDDTFNRRKNNTIEILFEQLNKFHSKIKFTIKLNPDKFQGTWLICVNSNYNIMAHKKSTKLPIAWLTKTPKDYKRNAIIWKSKSCKNSFDKLWW